MTEQPQDVTVPTAPPRRLLVATDLSARSDRALARARLLADPGGAGLLVLHVLDEEAPASLAQAQRAAAEELLRGQIAALPGPCPGPVEPVVASGDPHATVLRFAQSSGAELIVLGAHRLRPLRDLFTGTTGERVLRQGGLPVLVVRQPASRPYRRILFATDLSEHAARALRVARGFGWLDGAEVTALHAHEPPSMRGIGLANLPERDVQALAEAESRDARRRLEGFMAQAAPGLAATLVVQEGRGGAVIRDAVQRLRPDLLVMGTAGGGWLRQAMLGSVAAEVLMDTGCDTLAVPPAAG